MVEARLIVRRGRMAVQDHIERCAIEELLRLKPHLNISKLGDELLSRLKRTPRIDWFRWEVEHDRVVMYSMFLTLDYRAIVKL